MVMGVSSGPRNLMEPVFHPQSFLPGGCQVPQLSENISVRVTEHHSTSSGHQPGCIGDGLGLLLLGSSNVSATFFS